MRDKTSFTDYLSILYKWKKFLIINLVIIGVITTAITFLIPEKFKSTAAVMIQDSENSSLLGSLSQNFGGVLNRALGMGGGGNSEDKLFGFLSSRNFALEIIKKFDLINYYDVQKYKRDKTLKYFYEDFMTDLNDNGFIEISMIHKNPKIAAEIVNYAVLELDSINFRYNQTYAKKYREFVEKRYNQNLLEIKLAQNKLELFQKKYGIYAIPEQFEYTFKALGELESKLAIKEIESEFIAGIKGENSTEYYNSKKEVDLMREKINNIFSGKHSTDASVVFPPLSQIPKLQKEYFEIKLNLEMQTKLLEFTLPMYEQAVMEEQRNIPIITVIDEAVPAEIKNSPQKAIIILSVFFLFLFIQLPFIFNGEYLLERNPKNKFEEIEKRFYKKLVDFYKIQL